MLETAKHHRDSLGIALISPHYHPTLFPRRRDRRLANKSHAGQWKGEHEISGLDFRIELVVIKRAVLLISRKSHAAHDMGYRIPTRRVSTAPPPFVRPCRCAASARCSARMPCRYRCVPASWPRSQYPRLPPRRASPTCDGIPSSRSRRLRLGDMRI